MWEEFKPNFDKYVMPLTESGCWIWMGYISEGGYGRFCPKFKMIPLYAHRVSYEMRHGPIPDGMTIDHLCRVRCCVNPDHLEVVTLQENLARSVREEKVYCKHGHEFSPENTALRNKKTGGIVRICRACERQHGKLKYARKKARKKADLPAERWYGISPTVADRGWGRG